MGSQSVKRKDLKQIQADEYLEIIGDVLFH